MPKRFAHLAIGLVLGAVLVQALPTEAHFTKNTSYRHDWNHVAALQSQLGTLQSQLSQLTSRLQTLEAKTKGLDYSGRYTGSISASQITSGYLDASRIDTPFSCWGGDPAVWNSYGSGLSC